MTTHLNPSSCVHSKFVFIITNSRDTSPPLIISTPPPDPLTFPRPRLRGGSAGLLYQKGDTANKKAHIKLGHLFGMFLRTFIIYKSRYIPLIMYYKNNATAFKYI